MSQKNLLTMVDCTDREGNARMLFKPTREDILSLRLGDYAPDCFGQLAEVLEIYATGNDVNGKAFVSVYLRFGAGNSRVSQSYKEGQVLRTTNACAWFSSAELAALDDK